MISPFAREERWFAVQVKRNLFVRAERELTRQSLRVFAPKLERQKLLYGKMRSFSSLMFPGYLFVEGDDDQHVWKSVRATDGLTRLVLGGNKTPAMVPEAFIKELLSPSDTEGKTETPSHLNAGDTVSFVSGPFAGLITQIHQVDETQRVWLLLDMLGSTRAVAVNPELLVKLGPN
jgi:transcription elongation factor/antiterminator RfaH